MSTESAPSERANLARTHDALEPDQAGGDSGNPYACARTNLPVGARALGVPKFAGSVVPDDERQRLATSLGCELIAAREMAGLSRVDLAARAGCSYPMLRNLEQGRRRPRRSFLEALAVALLATPERDRLHPDLADADGRVAALTDRLVAAAGDSLRPETPGSERRRRHATEAARRARRREHDGVAGAHTRKTHTR